jgi:Mlc titration factor MtfA (ptsG expression regulator)
LLNNLLKQKIVYYSNLSVDGQAKFQERVLTFMESKDFIGREELLVTDEMKVLISASAVQLTFGLEDYLITHLHTINIFPRVFYSKLFNTSFKGLTTQGGITSISWNDFREGFVHEHDNINLGFHELAHALNVDLDENGNYDGHFSGYFETWKRVALNDFEKLKTGQITFLRSYGATNMHEFFAVCIEHFFESPSEFKKQLPGLYWHTAYLLNQDPDNAIEDYQLKKGLIGIAEEESTKDNFTHTSSSILKELNDESEYIQEKQLQRFIKAKGIYVAMITTVLGLFIGLPLLFWFASVTVISIGIIMLLIFGCGALGLIQWKYVKDYLDMEYHQFSMYAFTGFGMCFINLILFLNYIIPVKTYTETYPVSRVGYHNQSYEVILAGDYSSALEGSLGTYFNDHYTSSSSPKTITVTFDKGLFGFDIISNCKFN